MSCQGRVNPSSEKNQAWNSFLLYYVRKTCNPQEAEEADLIDCLHFLNIFLYLLAFVCVSVACVHQCKVSLSVKKSAK